MKKFWSSLVDCTSSWDIVSLRRFTVMKMKTVIFILLGLMCLSLAIPIQEGRFEPGVCPVISSLLFKVSSFPSMVVQPCISRISSSSGTSVHIFSREFIIRLGIEVVLKFLLFEFAKFSEISSEFPKLLGVCDL